MRDRSKGLIAAALTFAFLGHATVTRAQESEPSAVKLVWLVATVHGAPLGVFVWPTPLPMKACAARAAANQQLYFTPFEQRMGVYIGHTLGAMIIPSPLCLTIEEAASLVEAVKTQVWLAGDDA